MNQTELGLRIKQCRKLQHLTQENLAELIDVSPHYIYEIERGIKNMSINTLADISLALNTSTDYLLFGKQPNSPSTDQLNSILNDLPPQQRENIASIISNLLPFLK